MPSPAADPSYTSLVSRLFARGAVREKRQELKPKSALGR
jgi:hypothetical protein